MKINQQTLLTQLFNFQIMQLRFYRSSYNYVFSLGVLAATVSTSKYSHCLCKKKIIWKSKLKYTKARQ